MIVNARIKSTMLGIEDHGIMTFFLNLEWGGGTCCGLGGYALDQYTGARDDFGTGNGQRIGCAVGYQAIRRILETVGVDRWEKLPGLLVRIEDDDGNGGVSQIGHILENRWFDLCAYMKENQS